MKFSTQQSFRESAFFKILPPKLKQKLAFTCLEDLIKKFFYFFHDVHSGLKADDVMIRKIITSFSSSMHFPNETIKYPG